MLKACFPEFDKVVKDRTTPSYVTNGEWHFEHTKMCFVEEIIPFYEKLKTYVKGIEDNLFKKVYEYMKIFDELDKEYDQCVIDKKSLEIENKNLLIQNECLLTESVSKDICSVVLTFDTVVPMSVEPRFNYIKEHFRNLELEAEILKVCNNSNLPEFNVFFEINKLKVQLQGKDALIGKSKAQISNMKEVSAGPNLSTLEYQALETKNIQLKEELPTIRIKNGSLRDEDVSIKKRYQDLYKSKAESNSNVSIEDNLFKKVYEYMKIFDELDKEYDQCVIDKKSLEIENKNLLIQNECLLTESVSKDICSVVLTFDTVVPMSVEPRFNYIKEHFRNLELEAEILKVCNNSNLPEFNVFFEINKLKVQLQGKDALIGKSKAQISNMKEVSAGPNLSTLEYQALETKNIQLKEELPTIRIKNGSLRDEDVSIKKRYQDLYKSKAESNSNVSKGIAVPEKPKVLAPGLLIYVKSYIIFLSKLTQN
nr:hypothetical protein [Tanacetum cinerariifolium]